MTGEETVIGPTALVGRLFEAFAARDEQSLLAIMDPEIEFFGPTATILNEGKCYRGHDGMRRYLQDVQMLWAELEIVPLRYREVGNHVVVMGRVKARARDGLEMDAPAAWVWRVEGNRIAWGCVYGDREAMPGSLQEGGRGEYSRPGDLGPRPASPVDPGHLSHTT